MRRMVGASPARCSGQMSVEFAALLPVMLVVALVGLNLMRYVELCSEFDQVALDAVISQGVSPSGEQTVESAERQVRSCIEEAMGSERGVSVEVTSAEEGRFGGAGENLTVVPSLTRFTCTLKVTPWPGRFSIAGMEFVPPLRLVHERSVVVDRYRPGVVV